MRPRPTSAFSQRLPVYCHAGIDAQRQSAVLADVVAPSRGRPIPDTGRHATVPNPDAASVRGDRRYTSRVAGRRHMELRRGQTVERGF